MSGLFARLAALFAGFNKASAKVSEPAESSITPNVPPLSATDRDILIRTVYGEARGELPEGQRAVVHVIRNRVLARGSSAAVECQRPWQFSCWNADDPNREKLLAMQRASTSYMAIGKVVDTAWTAPDMVAGAKHYYSPAGMNGARPAWAKPPGREVARIGGHVFWAGVA